MLHNSSDTTVSEFTRPVKPGDRAKLDIPPLPGSTLPGVRQAFDAIVAATGLLPSGGPGAGPGARVRLPEVPGEVAALLQYYIGNLAATLEPADLVASTSAAMEKKWGPAAFAPPPPPPPPLPAAAAKSAKKDDTEGAAPAPLKTALPTPQFVALSAREADAVVLRWLSKLLTGWAPLRGRHLETMRHVDCSMVLEVFRRMSSQTDVEKMESDISDWSPLRQAELILTLADRFQVCHSFLIRAIRVAVDFLLFC